MKILLMMAATLGCLGSPISGRVDDEARVLFDFAEPAAAEAWQTVNDGVMGGRSEGRFRINDDHVMEFSGILSLENNGGFASVRSRPVDLDLKPGEAILARVKGDGREYNLNLAVDRNYSRNSYRQTFPTTKDEWTEVLLPLDRFVATYRGRVYPDEKLDPKQVNGVGFLLGDKKPGPFRLDVQWIKVVPAT